MNPELIPGMRVLAVDPAAKGLGFAVVERGEGLVAWGTRDARDDKHEAALKRVGELLDRYRPGTLVLEDYRAKGSRRRPQVRRLMRSIERLAASRRIEMQLISPGMRSAAFAEAGAATKCEIAKVLAERFPALARSLPPVRKPWMTEDHRLGIFDAVALLVAFFYAEREDTGAA
jgi:RNase H-fold protein (predicted Holliday junction resolvase)